MSDIKLYNSLTRKKETFTPIEKNNVRMYACGPTVYNYAHIGNARSAIVFDMLTRTLRTKYENVTYVANITDIDDKIIAASRETGMPISKITEKFTKIYNEDMASLGATKPDIQPKATETIQEMIALIENLIQNDHAYAADGHVLFNVPSFPAYGGLSGRNRDDQIAGARVEIAPYKKDAADFVLWKPSAKDEPGWDSPWGRGRPGWHIECSAMAEKHLGLPFDIHGGGADLKFPHHENEIAQSCCAHAEVKDLSVFAKTWVHNGFLTVEGEKMSKSLGNFTLAHDLLQIHDGETLRLTLLSAHYRQPLDWSDDKIAQNKKLLDRIYARLEQMKDLESQSADIPAPILDALYDDMNTPQAISALCATLKEENSAALKSKLLAGGNLLGILQKSPSQWLGFDEIKGQAANNEKIEVLLNERAKAKADKNYARADKIRDELNAMNIEIIDTEDGTKWKYKESC